MDKYKYLVIEDIGFKPSAVEQTRFEYSPFGKIFNNGPKEEDKKGLLKRLKNTEDKNEVWLKSSKKYKSIKVYFLKKI